jgi:hypothetical protein
LPPRTSYQPWTADDESNLRILVAERLDAPTIARRLQRPLTSVRNKLQALRLRIQYDRFSSDDTAPANDAERWETMRRRAQEEVQHKIESLDWLRPVELPAPPKPKVIREPAPFTLVAGDFHFGMSDQRACDVFLATVAELKPRRVILNGDTVDLLAVSRYPKDARRGKTWKLSDEVTEFHSFLHTLHSMGDAWKMEVIETSANHSGNGTDGRWWRYLNDRCPELLQHGEAEERLSYANWFFPKWSSIRLEDSVMLADDLLVLHGDMVRSEAAYTAKASREKWMNSVLVNHTHRMGLSPKTVTKIGNKPTSYVRGYENGCMCVLEVPYGRALNWQQGFAIVTEGANGFGVEQVFIDNGEADIASIGRTLRA